MPRGTLALPPQNERNFADTIKEYSKIYPKLFPWKSKVVGMWWFIGAKMFYSGQSLSDMMGKTNHCRLRNYLLSPLEEDPLSLDSLSLLSVSAPDY